MPASESSGPGHKLTDLCIKRLQVLGQFVHSAHPMTVIRRILTVLTKGLLQVQVQY